MSKYVDGFVIPIKRKNLKTYKKMATLASKIWMDHGALSYYETTWEKANVPWDKTFPKLCKLKSDETVIFAFIIYKSKAHQKKVNKLVFNDPRMKIYENTKMPFDMKRFSAGAFKVMVEKD